jgi:hypothetical protein
MARARPFFAAADRADFDATFGDLCPRRRGNIRLTIAAVGENCGKAGNLAVEALIFARMPRVRRKIAQVFCSRGRFSL